MGLAVSDASGLGTSLSAHSLGPQGLANTAWSFSVLVLPNMPLLNSVAERAIRTIRDFSQQNLSNIAWAFSTLVLPQSSA